MQCKYCGNENPDNSKFCLICGAPFTTEKPKVTLKCQSCGGEISVYESALDSGVSFTCPYCGSKSFNTDNDDVKVQRIKSNAYKDVELEKLRHAKETELRQYELEKQHREEYEIKQFKKSKLSILTLILFFASLLLTYTCFSRLQIIAGIVAGILTVTLAVSWLSGMRFIFRKNKNVHLLFILAAAIIFILFYKINGGLEVKEQKRLKWPDNNLTKLIPKPKSKHGEVHVFSDSISADIEKTSPEAFQKYVDGCIDNGFVVDAVSDNSSYDAYNEEGYKLSLDYYSSRERMDIVLDSPEEFPEIKWPDNEFTKLLPVPKSSKGKGLSTTDRYFSVTIGNTPFDDFSKYVDDCIAKGFDANYERSEKNLKASNSDGYKLTVTYEGNSTFKIYLEAPKKEIETEKVVETEKPAETKKTVKVEKVTDSNAVSETEAAPVKEEPNIDLTSSNTILVVQQALNNKGYDCGTPDGVAGNNTYEAIKKFKSEHSLEATPDITMDLLKALDVVSQLSSKSETPSASDSSTGLTPSFKKAIDEYEGFVDELVDFLSTYSETDASFEASLKYAKLMGEYLEFLAAFSKLEDSAETDEDVLYYVQAQNRINEKLITVSLNLQ